MSWLDVSRRRFIAGAGASAMFGLKSARAEASTIAHQPYFSSVRRAIDALAKLGSPIAPADDRQISALARSQDPSAVDAAEALLNPYTLAHLTIDADGKPHIAMGGARRTLVEQGWCVFLVGVANPAGRTDNMWITSGWFTPGQMVPLDNSRTAERPGLADTLNKAPAIEKMWLLSQLHELTPVILLGRELLAVSLSGSPVEYRVIQLYSRDHGQLRADLAAYILPKSGDGISASGHREFAFDRRPSRVVTLGVRDADGRGCMAALTIKDKFDHIYPPQAMRLAPDMFFQSQVYRADGETMRLPDGDYIVESVRGPEYLRSAQAVTIDASRGRIDVKLQRWIDPAKWGWYSGDTHIHAGGCAHYQNPTAGVSPETMIRHVRGEGLSIGDVLTWGPSYYYQRQFFTGHTVSPAAGLEHPELQLANNATLQPHATAEDSESNLRYDVEISQFPSSHCGHLVLLRFKDQDYPGTKLIEDWPSWNLPILKWVREQGALGGYAHCGIGMEVDSTDLPNYEIPPMDGIGTQEAIMDVTHGVCDYISGTNTNPVAELNAWYHMLNCGFRLAMLGETDWPCISGDRVGAGRSYVRLDHRPLDNSGYEAWIQGLKDGRLYFGDGRSHVLEFSVNGHRSGDKDLELGNAESVQIEGLVAARLDPELTPENAPRGVLPGYGWHLERARIGKTREVPVELLVNGVPVDKTNLVADGTPRTIKFMTRLARSSWVALRIYPSAHTHPVFVHVDGKPIRASKRSAQWCRQCVDKVWEVKSPFMRESERPAAAEAFDHARKAYETILGECETD